MKNLSLILFTITFLASVHSQMNNTWTFAWQNSPIGSLCIPEYITIDSSDSITFNVSYIYSSSVQLSNCPSDPINSSTLTQPNTSVLVYTDTQNNTITYTTTAPENVEFTLNNTNSTFFYLNSQDLISQPVTLGIMGAYWNSPANASDDSDCTCVPDYVLVLPTSEDAPTLEYYSYYTTQPNCAQNFSEALSLTTSTPSSISWVSPSNITFTYTPSTVSNITYTYFNSSAGVSCPYSYQRSVNTTGIIANGSWVPDWQDNLAANYSSYPSYYQVTNMNSQYMTTTFTLNNQSYNSYLVQNTEGQYQDVYLNQSFTYDQPTNTFTVVPASTPSPNFIYSQNGSLFSTTPFIQLWGTPQTNDDTSNCCVFSYVNITTNSTNNNTLNVVYTPPEGYSDATSPCSDYATYYTSGGVLEGYLVIEDPSITALTWVDEVFNSTVAFAAGSNSTISVQFPSACPISMVVTSPPSPNPPTPTPTPTPTPLFGSWISMKVVGLVMGLFVGIVCM